MTEEADNLEERTMTLKELRQLAPRLAAVLTDSSGDGSGGPALTELAFLVRETRAAECEEIAADHDVDCDPDDLIARAARIRKGEL